MKRIGLVFVLLSLLLAGCGADPPADTPTIGPTDTPTPPTSTPEPTATPTPEPTATPEPTPTPTPEPTLPPLDDLIEELTELGILWDAEVAEFEAGYYRWAIGLANTILDKWAEEYPFMYSNRADSYANLGYFDLAIKDLETAARLPYMKEFKRFMENPDTEESVYTEDEINTIANLYNNLCWYLAITSQPDRALPYCEEAVALFPSIAILDSRAVAYALLGQTEDAISDFEQVFALVEDDPFGIYEEIVKERKQWVAALQNGDDPFTAEVLESLRQETIDPAALPEGEVRTEYTFTYFTEFMVQDGFEYLGSDTNEQGIPYDFYGTMIGECTMLVGVFGDEDRFAYNRLLFSGCTEEQIRGEVGWFGRLMLLADPYQDDDDCIPLGQLYAWQITEMDSIIAGDITETSDVKIKGITFSAGWSPEGDLLMVDARLTD